jgi:hypothetical protein
MVSEVSAIGIKQISSDKASISSANLGSLLYISFFLNRWFGTYLLRIKEAQVTLIRDTMGAWEVILRVAVLLAGGAAAAGPFSLEMRTLLVYSDGVYNPIATWGSAA